MWCKLLIGRACTATNQKVACSSHAGRTIQINNLKATGGKTAHPAAHPHRVAWRIKGVYSAAMANTASTLIGAAQVPAKKAHSGSHSISISEVSGVAYRGPKRRRAG